MNQKEKKPLEILLKESLVVNPLNNAKKVERCTSERKRPEDPQKLKSQLIKSQSLHKKRPTFVKYPLKSVPFGLEQKKPALKPTPPPAVQKESSTTNFLNRLRQIEKKTNNVDFLEDTNQEIMVAFQQLQEIHQLIARKMTEREKQEQQQELYEATNKRQNTINRFSKEFQRMQRNYANKAKIRYKSLKDFENITLNKNERKIEEVKEIPDNKQVKLLYKKGSLLRRSSSTNCLPVEEVIVSKTPTVQLFLGNEETLRTRGRKIVQAARQRTEMVISRSGFNEKTGSQILSEKVLPLLKSEDVWTNDEMTKVLNKMDEVDKIKYLLQPKHCSDTPRKTTKTDAAIQSDSGRNKTQYNSEPKERERSKSMVRTKSNPNRRVRFTDTKIEESILQSNVLSSSSEDSLFESKDDTVVDIQEDIKNNSQTLSTIRETAGYSWKTAQEREMEKKMKERTESQKKALRFDLSASKKEGIFADSETTWRDEDVQSDNRRRRGNRERPKIDESISTFDSQEEKFADGKKKLNLLLHGKEQVNKESDSTDLADSVLKSAFLSKEFVGPSDDLEGPDKDKKSMDLLRSVVQKFRAQALSSQLPKSAKRRDQKLYTTLNSALKDTLYTEIQK